MTESLMPLETGSYSADYGESSKDFKQRSGVSNSWFR